MCITNERSPSEKATYCVIPTIWHSGKGKILGHWKDQWWPKVRSTQRIFAAALFWYCNGGYVSLDICPNPEWTTPRVNPNLSYGLWETVTSKSPFQCWSSGCMELEWLWGDSPCPRAKEKPQQDGRRVETVFRFNPTSARDAQRAQTLCIQGPRDPTETETELCLSVSWGGTGQHWTAEGTGALGAVDLGVEKALLKEVAINPTTEPPELTRDWGNRLLEGTKETCAHQDIGERSSDPTRDWPRLACECPGVSGGGVGQRWPAAELKALNVAVCAWDLLKEVAIIFITSTIVWPHVKEQGGNTAPPSTENWIKYLLSMAPPIRKRPSFPFSQSLPLGRFHMSLIHLHQRADRVKITITDN